MQEAMAKKAIVRNGQKHHELQTNILCSHFSLTLIVGLIAAD
jgi:hypothetical protein